MNDTIGKADDRLQFYIITEDAATIDIPEEYGSYISCLRISDSEEHSDNREERIEYSEDDLPGAIHYGKAYGLYHIWKNVKSDYIGFSLTDCIPDITIDNIGELLCGSPQVIMAEFEYSGYINLEDYRDNYFDYDMRVLCECIARYSETMSSHNNEYLYSNKKINPTVIMRKDVFRKFCTWVFPILDKCRAQIPDRISNKQNRYLEHLMSYLVGLYISYYYDRLNPTCVHGCRQVINTVEKCEEYREFDSSDEFLVHLQTLIEEGSLEKAESLLKHNPGCPGYDGLKAVFDDYNRQRRRYALTNIDKMPILQDLLKAIDRNRSEKLSSDHKPKVLLIVWDSFNIRMMYNSLDAMGFDVETLFIGNSTENRFVDKWERVSAFLDEHFYEFVISTNYFDYISEACYVHDTPYLAWTYDSPTDMGNRKLAKYDTTHVFLFDSSEVDTYRRDGFSNIYYLPLAVDIDSYDAMIPKCEDIDRFSSEISFVGQLYNNQLNEYLNYLPDYKKGFLNALIDYNTFKYIPWVIEDVFSKDLTEWLNEKAFIDKVMKNEKTDKDIADGNLNISMIPSQIVYRIHQTIAHRERVLLVSMLANHWQVKLYSRDTHELFDNVIECGKVDYEEEMPYVFKCSKINLNSTVKHIRTGIPLRCLDVMGCGGFLLSNYQQDFDEHFKDGENIAIFRSLDEAYDKCEYYLKHEDERIDVARKGYETVKKYYSYDVLIRHMLNISGLGYLLQRI